MNVTMSHDDHGNMNMNATDKMSGHNMNMDMNITMDMNDMDHNHMDNMHDHHMEHMNVSECLSSMDVMSIVWITINIILLANMIPLMYKFIKMNLQKRSKKKQKWYLFYPGIIFTICTFIILIADTVVIFFYECNHFWWMLFMLIFGSTYTLQIVLVFTILFARTYFIFKSSAYALSKRTIIIYCLLFIMVPCSVGLVEAWYHISHHSEVSSTALALCYVFNMLVMVSLLTLFTQKLFITYTNLPTVHDPRRSETHRNLMKVITRTVVLTSISLLFTLIASIGFITIDKWNTFGQMMIALLVIIDVYTNFVCILLSYAFFDRYYQKLCGKFDHKIGQICNYISGTDVNTLIRLTSTSTAKSSPAVSRNRSKTQPTCAIELKSNSHQRSQSQPTSTDETTTTTTKSQINLSNMDSNSEYPISSGDETTGIEIVSI